MRSTLHTQLQNRHTRHCASQQRVASNQQASTSGDSSRNLSSRGKSSTRAWQHQWRYMRSEKARTAYNLPEVDWSRYHLQVSAWALLKKPASQLAHACSAVLCDKDI